MSLGSIHRPLEIPFSRGICVCVETRVGHEIVSLDEGEGVFRFLHRQYYFKANLCQQRLNVNQVEVPPPLLIQVTAVDSDEVDKKSVDDRI